MTMRCLLAVVYVGSVLVIIGTGVMETEDTEETVEMTEVKRGGQELSELKIELVMLTRHVARTRE